MVFVKDKVKQIAITAVLLNKHTVALGVLINLILLICKYRHLLSGVCSSIALYTAAGVNAN